MNLGEISAICEATKGHCFVNIYVDNNGKIHLQSVNFWKIDRENVLTLRKRYGLGTLNKNRVGTDIDWESGKVRFNRVAECKIIGYKTKYVPAHDEKIPVFECP